MKHKGLKTTTRTTSADMATVIFFGRERDPSRLPSVIVIVTMIVMFMLTMSVMNITIVVVMFTITIVAVIMLFVAIGLTVVLIRNHHKNCYHNYYFLTGFVVTVSNILLQSVITICVIMRKNKASPGPWN